MKKYAKVKSLYKAMLVLEAFSIEKPEMSVTELSNQLGLYKSNIYNILATFEEMGYITQDPQTCKYRLGYKILNLSYIFNAHMSLQRIILPYMQKIADETHENVYLAVPVEHEVVYLESCSPYGVVPKRSLQGERAPMYCTAIGKAILAFSGAAMRKKVQENGFIRFTENTLTDKDTLDLELKSIQQNGYAIDNMEHEYGIKCVAMPIRKKNGDVYAALSISGPSLRMDDETLVRYMKLLQQQIVQIERDYSL